MHETFKISIPTNGTTFDYNLNLGQSVIIVGANGAGKTRLGVYIEEKLDADKVTRIAAHRSLTISDKLSAVSFERAMSGLRSGSLDSKQNNYNTRSVYKYGQNPSIALVSDFDFLLQALFAEQSRVAITHLQNHRLDLNTQPPLTIIAKLIEIWGTLLPHRQLSPAELSINVTIPQGDDAPYLSSNMSDGERVLFYMLGHCLLAPKNSVIIIDEPELHIHKAILSKLWDTIEAERSDCAFIYISHDLDFVAARPSAQKLYVSSYLPKPEWEITPIPSDIELPERLIVELVGSRQPILFVEGKRESLDAAIYRSIYSDFLIEPIGDCSSVIYAVSTFSKHKQFHHLTNVVGCIDRDSRTPQEISELNKLGIQVLPVSEIENCLLLPEIFIKLAMAHYHSEEEAKKILSNLTQKILEEADRDKEAAAIRFTTRHLDRKLKLLTVSGKTIEEFNSSFEENIAHLKPAEIANEYISEITKAIKEEDITKIIVQYDNKALLSFAAQLLGYKNRKNLEDFVSRLLLSTSQNDLRAALQNVLPNFSTT